MAEKTKLRQLREELGVVQEDMALTAGIRINTYRNAERGGKTTYATAAAILKAVNTFRSNRQLPLLTLEDLELS